MLNPISFVKHAVDLFDQRICSRVSKDSLEIASYPSEAIARDPPGFSDLQRFAQFGSKRPRLTSPKLLLIVNRTVLNSLFLPLTV
jgi:hypothetical protein